MSATNAYSKLPHEPSCKVEPYTVDVPDSELESLKTLLTHTRVPKETFENAKEHKDDFGVTRGWFIEARDAWLKFDWRKTEARINEQAHYLAHLPTGDTMHFMALLSSRTAATPVVFCNGWPSCFLEFLPLFEHVAKQYSSQDLPYHLIVPSLPGYVFSSKPPVDREYGYPDVIKAYASLMAALGFKSYIAQGSDLGGAVIDGLAQTEACKAIHATNRYLFSPPEGTPEYEKMKSSPPDPSAASKKMLPFAYALEQGTKPATIGLALGCSPMSLLAWNGEKIRLVSHPTLDLDTILSFTSLWWFTDTNPSSISLYRQVFGAKAGGPQPPKPTKPLGYSHLPYDLGSAPVHWVEKAYNLVWSKEHKDGGHFPFLEHPADTWSAFEEFVQTVQQKLEGDGAKL